ncbi:hypothetical protein [Mycobacterium sp.]|uniref:hypothetical protein n=1 Tax=Mycobacterium sp. TaxID=1785 RepID=UPI002D9856B9|nr:hypothetical protein [Mycobacterium sp.]
MPSFVVEFNRHTRDRRVTEFASPHEAMEYRLKLESTRTDEAVEIAALFSKSREALERTHSRYFTGKELTAL